MVLNEERSLLEASKGGEAEVALEVERERQRRMEGVMNGIYEMNRSKPGSKEKERKESYSILMDHLDAMEMRKPQWGKYVKRGLGMVLFSGLVALLVVSLSVHPTNRKRILSLRIWQWATMALMITAILSVVPFATWLVSLPLMVVFRTHKYWVYYLKGMKRSVDFTLWSWLVLAGWYMWFRPHLKHVHGDISVVACHQITRLLIALCIGFLLWSFKRALYLKLEADLHYDQLFDRISQTIIFLNGLIVLQRKTNTTADQHPPDFLTYDPDLLRDRSDYAATCKKFMHAIMYELKRRSKNCYRRFHNINPSTQPTDQGEAATPDHPPPPSNNTNNKCTNIWMDVRRMRRETVPIWILVRLSKEYLKAIKSIRPRNAADIISDDDKLLEMAKQMFRDITGSTKNHIDQFGEIKKEDLANPKYKLSQQELDYLFRKKAHEEQAEENNNLDANQGEAQARQYKCIRVDEFLQWAVRVHKNCWGLERTLRSSRLAFVKLNRMLSTFLFIVVVIIWLLLSKIVNTGQVALLFAPFLAVSFMFENSSKNLFQGIIFAFAMHPFDVGDRVIIDNIQMRVKEVHILTSVFYKYDTGADVIYPNSKLATTKIVNLDITPDQSDQLDFIIGSKTPLENIRDLELTVQRLLDDDIYHPSGSKVVKGSIPKLENTLETETGLTLTVHFKYLVSYLTADKKAARKSEILGKIMRIYKEMDTPENKKEYPLDCVPYHIELTTTNKKVMPLLGIHRIKQEILKRAKKEYRRAKIVLTHVEDDEIKMALYVCNGVEIGSQAETANEEEHKLKSDEKIQQDSKTDFSFFLGFESLLSQYGYNDHLKVVRGDKTIYPSSIPKFQALINKAVTAKGKDEASTSTATP